MRERGSTSGVATPARPTTVVVACGSYSAPLLRPVGVDLPIYPGKGYSATFKLKKPELAPFVSTIDDEVKVRHEPPGRRAARGRHHRAVGLRRCRWTHRWRKARCRMLARRIEEVLPGVCDTRSEEEGGNPRFWTGLRPATPTNIPYIGRTKVGRLWVNAGHGTLGWTHGAGSGKAMAELIERSGSRRWTSGFYGYRGSRSTAFGGER